MEIGTATILKQMAKQSVFLTACLVAFYYNDKYEYLFVVGWICLVVAINFLIYNLILSKDNNLENRNDNLEDELERKNKIIRKMEEQMSKSAIERDKATTNAILENYKSLNDQTDIK